MTTVGVEPTPLARPAPKAGALRKRTNEHVPVCARSASPATWGKRVSGMGGQHGTKFMIKPAPGRSLPKTSAWVNVDRERGLMDLKWASLS